MKSNIRFLRSVIIIIKLIKSYSCNHNLQDDAQVIAITQMVLIHLVRMQNLPEKLNLIRTLSRGKKYCEIFE